MLVYYTKMAAPPAKRARHNELNSEFEKEEDPAVTLFREYLRIPTVSRGDDYQKHYGERRAVHCVRRLLFWSSDLHHHGRSYTTIITGITSSTRALAVLVTTQCSMQNLDSTSNSQLIFVYSVY